MNYYVASATDTGTTRKVNQDRIWADQYFLNGENVVCAVLCDGMGGLQHGEIASGFIADAFSEWARLRLPELEFPLMDHVLREEWTKLILAENQKIRAYGEENNCVLGSTVTALLLTEKRYFILNVGDSRAYEIATQAVRLTVDHTVIEDEVSRGNMTPEQAQVSPMKSVLTKCVGVRNRVYPDLFFGDTKPGAVYMLCSDGFRHCVKPEEMKSYLLSGATEGPRALQTRALELIELNKRRGEHDNISVIAVYVKKENGDSC